MLLGGGQIGRFKMMPRIATSCMFALLMLVSPCAALAHVEYRSAFVAADDGARIHYLHGGRASERPMVVFIPGWTWTAEAWLEQMRRLDDREVVAIDPRSQGESSKTGERNSPEGRATDIHALLEVFGKQDVVLVGWSQGVQDIAAYVERYGTGRLAGVVLVDSSLSIGSELVAKDPEQVKRLLDRIAILAEHPKEYIDGMYDASRARQGREAEKIYYTGLSRKTPADIGMAMLVTDALTKNRTPVLARIDKPLLVIASSASEELDEQREIARRVPGAHVVVIGNAGHAVFLDQPDVFAKALGSFLAGLEPR